MLNFSLLSLFLSRGWVHFIVLGWWEGVQWSECSQAAGRALQTEQLLLQGKTSRVSFSVKRLPCHSDRKPAQMVMLTLRQPSATKNVTPFSLSPRRPAEPDSFVNWFFCLFDVTDRVVLDVWSMPREACEAVPRREGDGSGRCLEWEVWY